MFNPINGGKLPTRGSKYSACVDVYANEDVSIGAGETVVVGLGIRIDIQKIDEYILKTIPYGYEESLVDKTSEFMKSHYISLKPRSSIRAKGLISHSAVIDLDYEDEIKIIIHKPLTIFEVVDDDYSEEYEIKKGDRIGQLTLLEHRGYLFGIESEEERTGGFGSTGSK